MPINTSVQNVFYILRKSSMYALGTFAVSVSSIAGCPSLDCSTKDLMSNYAKETHPVVCAAVGSSAVTL